MRLIDADAMLDDVLRQNETIKALGIEELTKMSLTICDGIKQEICNQPTIDAVEVVHGEWVETEKKEWGIYPFKKKTCSVCDCEIDHIFMLACMDYFDDRDTVFHYCPNCGAKMDGERTEE